MCKEAAEKQIKLLCGCFVCSEGCLDNFVCEFLNSLIDESKNKFDREQGKCSQCGSIVKLIDLIEMINNRKKESSTNKEICFLMNKLFKTFCLECLLITDETTKHSKEVRVQKEERICKYMGVKSFNHKICSKCYKTKTSQCKICECYHFTLLN